MEPTNRLRFCPVTAEISSTGRSSSFAAAAGGPRPRRAVRPWSRPRSRDARASCGIVFGQLFANRPVVVDRVGAVHGRRFDQMDQHARPFDVPQELVSQPGTPMGTFDQTRDVGQNEELIDDRPGPFPGAGSWW